MDDVLVALRAAIAQRGYAVRETCEVPVGLWAITYYDAREVWVDPDLSAEIAAHTLAHELGHLCLHLTEGQQRRPPAFRELEAEVFAASLLAALGVDVWPRARAYLAQHVTDLLGLPWEHYTAQVSRAQRACNRMLTEVQRNINLKYG